MVTLALYVTMEPKPGKEAEIEAFLKSAQPLVEAEPGTIAWFAIRAAPNKFAIFDVFENEPGRQAHLTGKVAAALFAKAPELFASAPEVHKPDLLAAKLPHG
jgi:quinol monooxygenase YgiN